MPLKGLVYDKCIYSGKIINWTSVWQFEFKKKMIPSNNFAYNMPSWYCWLSYHNREHDKYRSHILFVLNSFFYNKQLYFMKGIYWYHIWSYKNTNLLNVCVVLFILHIWCSISSLILRTYKKLRNSIWLSSSNLLLCI